MSYKTKKGDMFEAKVPALGHGCNIQPGGMGGGVAYLMSRRYPEMELAYSTLCAEEKIHPGEFYRSPKQQDGKVIYNLATQVYGGADARVDMIETAVGNMLEDAEQHGIKKIGIPQIGAGIGGLDWQDVEAVIKPKAKSSPVELIVYTLPGPTVRQRLSAAWRAYRFGR